jgi:hypothetical protein
MATAKLPEKLLGLPSGVNELMYRGRAAEKLLEEASRKAWNQFKECPYEDLVSPERVHVDPLGYVHICQRANDRKRLARALLRHYSLLRPFKASHH